jgi:3-oxoacyl-[acyl-carrier-protein] synthase III
MPAVPSHVRGARFIGWGTALGHKTVTNDDLSQTLDTSDAWIRDDTLVGRHQN